MAQAHRSLAGGAPWRCQRPRGGGVGGGGLRLVTGDARPQRTGPAAETQDVESRLRRQRRPGAAGSGAQRAVGDEGLWRRAGRRAGW